MRAAALAGLVWASAGGVLAQAPDEIARAKTEAVRWCIDRAESLDVEVVGPAGFQPVFGKQHTWRFGPADAHPPFAAVSGGPGVCFMAVANAEGDAAMVERTLTAAGYQQIDLEGGRPWERRSAGSTWRAALLPQDDASAMAGALIVAIAMVPPGH